MIRDLFHTQRQIPCMIPVSDPGHLDFHLGPYYTSGQYMSRLLSYTCDIIHCKCHDWVQRDRLYNIIIIDSYQLGIHYSLALHIVTLYFYSTGYRWQLQVDSPPVLCLLASYDISPSYMPYTLSHVVTT